MEATALRAGLLVVAVLAGCTAEIESPSRRGSPGGGLGPAGAPPGGSGESPGPASPGGGGGPGAAGDPRPGAGSPAPLDPGRVTMRRLNRTEYNNTVRDLLGTRLRPADAFASDPSGFGYDNNSDVQSLTPLQLDHYLTAAGALVDELTAGGAAAVVARAGIQPCDLAADVACRSRLIKAFARKAFRRPVPDQEVTRLLAPAGAAARLGDDALAQLAVTLRAILSSPHFLFRVEPDPDPGSLTPRLLGHHEVAARLSYFLWSSMPDAALFAAADGARLGTEAELRAQARRMLADPRAAALVDSFAAQWLSLGALDEHQVDPRQFTYDRAFARLARGETLAFFREFLGADLPVAEMLRAPFGFVDDRLAAHYGLPPVGTSALTRVPLMGDQRQGLLTQAAILTRTSFPARTSPTVRGAWIATHLLCSPPPPPPPDVPAFPEPTPGVAATVRQRLEAHRVNPACAGCHSLVDPIGLGLENYDLVGRYRTTDRGAPIDASGELPGGERFGSAPQLLALLAADPRLAPCVARNLITYALGRGLEPSDEPAVAQVVQRAAGARAAGPGLQGMILEVVASVPFRMRRGEPAPSGGNEP